MCCLPGPAARDMHGTRGSKEAWIARSRTPSSPMRHRRRSAWPERLTFGRLLPRTGYPWTDESGDCPESFLAGASPSGAREASGPSPPSSAAIWRGCRRGAAPGRLRGRTCVGRSSATWAPVGKAAKCGSRDGGMHAAKPAGRPARVRRRSRPAGFPLRKRRICRRGLTCARGPLGPPGRGSASSGRRPPRPR